MVKLWHNLFLEERSSLSLSVFRMFVAFTVWAHVFPSLCFLSDNYFSTAFKTHNTSFFTQQFVELVQSTPEWVIVMMVWTFCVANFFFFVGLFSQLSCIVMTLSCYYFYALNSFHVGTLSWDILLVTVFLMCLTPYHGDYFSVDSVLRKKEDSYKTKRPFFIQRLLQLQIAFTYFYTALYKVTPQSNGNWLLENPLYYVMNYPPAGTTKWFLLRDFIKSDPQFCYILGVLIVVIEFSMIVLLFWRRTRISAIYLGIIFHIALILTLDVPAIFFFLFPAQLFLFINPDDILKWVEQKRSVNANSRRKILVYDGQCQFCLEVVKKLKVMDLFEKLNYVDLNSVSNFEEINSQLTKEVALSQIHLIDLDGKLFGGFFALRKILKSIPMLYPMLLIAYLPGMEVLGLFFYKLIAKNRFILHLNPVCKNHSCFRKT